MANLKTNFVYNALLGISQIIFPLITFPYASRILQPEGIGTVSFVDNFTQYFITIAALGIPAYGVREIAKKQKDKMEMSKLFSELISIHFSVSILAALVYWLIVINTDKFSSNLELCKIGVILIISNTFLIEWFYQGLEQFKFVVIRTILIRFLTIILLFLVVRNPGDTIEYYGLNIISALLGAIVNIYTCRNYIKITFKNLEIRKHLKPLFIILSTSIVISVYTLMDTILLGFITTNKIVGYYTATIRVGRFPLAIVGALGAVLIPRLSNMFKKEDNKEAAILLDKSLQFSLLLSIPIAFGTFCLSKEVILLFAGKEFLSAIPSLQIFSFVVIIVGIAQVYSQQILLPIGKENYILIASGIGMIISILSNIILIPYFNHVGAALSSIITELTVTIILFYFSQRYIPIKLPMREILFSSLTCSIFILFKYLILLITNNTLIIILLTVPICAIWYIFSSLILWKNKIMLDTFKSYFKIKNVEL